MDTKHTPGPWQVDMSYRNDTQYYFLWDNKHKMGKESEKEAVANAKLMSAAPDLLKALDRLDKAASRFADDHAHYYEKGNQHMIDAMLAELHNAHLKAREAILKATV